MIGVFDSGIGGLLLVRRLREALPDRDVLFLGDTACGPYETKSTLAAAELTRRGVRWLQKQGAQSILLATQSGVEAVAEEVSDPAEPHLLEMVAPAVKAALACSGKRCVGVIGAAGSEAGNFYANCLNRLDPEAKLYYTSCPLLIPLLENRWDHKPEARMIVKKYLHPLKTRQIDTLIIANPYHELLRATIQRKIGRRVKLISAVSATIATLIPCESTPETKTVHPGRIRLCVTDFTPGMVPAAKRLYGGNARLESVAFA